jgi:N-acetylglucosamine kinase-like BadF-type ATPase
LTTHLAIDAGQTGIRTRAGSDEREFPGILTSEPLIPQLARLIRELGTFDTVSIGSTGLTAEETDPAGLRELVGAGQVLMAHDSVTSYLGALGAQRGAVVAVGTGVVTLAVGATAVARVDGWGNLIGDAGSGYWIGRAALDAVMRAHDGRGPATALTDVVRADFPDLEQAYIELQGDPGRVRRIASYARTVADLAGSDDVAARICREAAAELAHSVITALERVDEDSAPLVCGIGGVLRGDAIAGPFAAALRARWERVDIRDPLGSGIDGAALLPDVGRDSALYPSISRT